MLYLGTVTPKFTSWENFPNPSINGKFIRVGFLAIDGLPLTNTKSYILLRRKWSGTTPPTTSKIITANPDDTKAVLIHLPDADDFAELDLGVCQWEIKKAYSSRYYGLVEPAYSVSLDEG